MIKPIKWSQKADRLGLDSVTRKFAAIAILLFSAMYQAYISLFQPSLFYRHYLEMCAELSADLLAMINEKVTVAGQTMTSQYGQSVSVVNGCDGIGLFITLVAVTMAYNASLLYKIIGLALGLFFLYLLNLCRIALLLWIEIYEPQLFDVAHQTIFPLILWFAVMLVFAIWAIVDRNLTNYNN